MHAPTFGRSAPWLAGLAVLAGCAAPPPAPAPTAAPTPTARQAAASPPPIVAAAFDEVVARAGQRLLRDARQALGDRPRELVIDPLVDANSGQQTAGTVAMAQQLAALVRAEAPPWTVKPLTRAGLASRPLLLIGTLTPIRSQGDGDEPADAFRVCLAIADLATSRLVAKRADRATAPTVPAEPTTLSRESPTWALDQTTAGYIRTCQGSAAGDAVDAAYLQRLPAAAVVHEAQAAYAEGKPQDAYRLFREAEPLAEPGDLRLLNGLYLASWKTGKRKEAAEAFARIVDAGLDARRLPIKFLFNPGSTTLVQASDLPAQYAIWMRELARSAGDRDGCLRVVGHTSRTGDAQANEALSLRRAAFVKQSLERQNRKLANRLVAEGVGSRETISNLGTDDLRDALDRRVEFKPADCPG